MSNIEKRVRLTNDGIWIYSIGGTLKVCDAEKSLSELCVTCFRCIRTLRQKLQ